MALFSSACFRSMLCQLALRNLRIANKFAAIPCRGISLSNTNFVKEIKVTKEGNTTMVEGVIKESPWKDYVVKLDGPPDVCPLCKLNLPLRHTDVLILSQFVRSNGVVLPASVTGLCSRQQKMVEKLVSEAQKAGLMVNLQPPDGKRDPRRRHKWEKWNTYFLTEEEQWWKEIDKKESHYYEKPAKKKILSLQDVL